MTPSSAATTKMTMSVDFAPRARIIVKLVTRSIQEHYATLFTRAVRVLNEDTVGTNVLRNTAGLARRYIRVANGVEETGLTVVDVTHDGHYGSTRELDVVRVGGDELLKFLLDDHLLERNELEVEAVVQGHFSGHGLADGLIECRENLSLHEQLHHIARRNAESLSKLANGRSLNKTDLAKIARLGLADLA